MNRDTLVGQLESLRVEHDALDTRIAHMAADGIYDDIRIVRLKKRKLAVKDLMGRLESELVPDIVA